RVLLCPGGRARRPQPGRGHRGAPSPAAAPLRHLCRARSRVPAMTQLLQRLSEYRGEVITSIVETGVMMGTSLLAALLVGLPIGTLLHLARPGGPYPRRWLYRALN